MMASKDLFECRGGCGKILSTLNYPHEGKCVDCRELTMPSESQRCGHTPGYKDECDAAEHGFGEGNPFEADGHERCPCCKRTICGGPAFKDRHATYEESGMCAECAAASVGLSVIEFLGAMNEVRSW